MATRDTNPNYPKGHTRTTRSIASLMHDALGLSKHWNGQQVAIYRDMETREYFGLLWPRMESLSDWTKGARQIGSIYANADSPND